MRLSVVIPSYKDPLLHKTIASILTSATGEIEIIPVLDGYKPIVQITSDSRVKPLYLKENVGMREAINRGVQASTGKYIMRTDEHCLFAPGFDKEILKHIKDNQIVTARRYFLDVEKWKVMDIKPVDYEKLIIVNDRWHKFAGQRWRTRERERESMKIDETMAMQGSFWIMPRSWWNKVIKRLDSNGYGILYQDSVEMLMKTWQAGGKLMVNKNTWFAHKHVDFNRTHRYSTELSRASFAHSISVWGDYYNDVVAPRWGISG